MTTSHPVLVVDDDPAIRSAVRDVLEQEGIPVETAADGRVALDRVRELHPRLILLDMRMPVMDGWGFADALQELGMSPPVVVMTAAADARRWAAEIGAAAVVPKPFGVTELLDVVEQFSD